jgi:AcrR family transcriptional regulator
MVLDVGVAEIARRAGVGTATLFRRFPTKDDLILAVVHQRIERSSTSSSRDSRTPIRGAAWSVP